jgi:hypothetical protein
MQEIYLRGIDEILAERIKAVARAREITINDAMLELLRKAVGLSNDPVPLEHADIANLAGAWGSDEMSAFRRAIRALESLPEDIYKENLTELRSLVGGSNRAIAAPSSGDDASQGS